MAKGNKKKQKKGKTITLEAAKKCIKTTKEGKQCLDLSLKELSSLPPCTEHISDIQELDLSRNLICDLSDFPETLLRIKLLDLHSNSLEQFPMAIIYLHNLRLLNLCNNRLTKVASEIGQLKKLQTLYLGLNFLKTLPSTIANLKELSYLGLTDNQFTVIPRCLMGLNPEKFNIDRNPLRTEVTPTLEKVSFYLVREKELCAKCLKKCQTEKKKLENPGKPRRERGKKTVSTDHKSPPSLL